MQGRLLPPQNGRFQCFPRDLWRDEFPLAASAGLDAIEWIYDLHGADVNPITTDDGILEIKAISKRHGIGVVSVCADYFMDRPFVMATPNEFSELTGHLRWLLDRCRQADISRIVLPFVDGSRMETEEHMHRVAEMLRKLLPYAEAAGVEIHLETSLGPEMFAAFLGNLPHAFLKVNYDAGNSASLGYDVQEELAAYGRRIGSVHIKDRVVRAGTVPLGTGNADIPALLGGLQSISYQGDYVLQVARGEPGNELDWAKGNLAYLLRLLERASCPSNVKRQ